MNIKVSINNINNDKEYISFENIKNERDGIYRWKNGTTLIISSKEHGLFHTLMIDENNPYKMNLAPVNPMNWIPNSQFIYCPNSHIELKVIIQENEI